MKSSKEKLSYMLPQSLHQFQDGPITSCSYPNIDCLMNIRFSDFEIICSNIPAVPAY